MIKTFGNCALRYLSGFCLTEQNPDWLGRASSTELSAASCFQSPPIPPRDRRSHSDFWSGTPSAEFRHTPLRTSTHSYASCIDADNA